MKRLLIVDDDLEIAKRLAALLEDRYEVIRATTGFEALEQLEHGPFDLVLLDLRMPGLDGQGFLSEMRRRNETTPVVVLSADPNVARVARGMGVDYRQKPFDVEELEQLIERRVGF
ncbi:MAG TPA: response regulator [Gemmatimonadales bacterium]|nr:response regulator [Gemmatimonadales bacterium]